MKDITRGWNFSRCLTPVDRIYSNRWPRSCTMYIREQLHMPVHLPIQRNIVPLTDFHFLTLSLLPLLWQVSSEILIPEARMWTNDVAWILLRETHLHWPALIYRESGFYYILRFVSSTSGRYPTSILSLSLLSLPCCPLFLLFSAALSPHSGHQPPTARPVPCKQQTILTDQPDFSRWFEVSCRFYY